jgi:flagellar basal-body rod protein FlgF
MIRGLYTSALGLSVLTKEQEITTNNLANSQTAGYKQDVLVAEAFPEMLFHRLRDPLEAGQEPPFVGQAPLGVRINSVYTDVSIGVQRQVENPLSFAVREGYFTVQTPRGERYTRKGDFSLDSEGRLVSGEGYPVLGEQGEIFLPQGSVEVDAQGRLYSEGVEIDRLRIVNPGTTWEKEAASLFRGENSQRVEEPQVRQGVIEESNVDPLRAMVDLITTLRAYEANQKVIQAIDTTLDKAVNEVGRL